MIEIALIQLRLKGTDKHVFQRRDSRTPISPGLLGYFGGEVETGEPPDKAAARELKEETSLDVGSLTLEHLVSIDFPPHLSGDGVNLRLHLFGTIIPSPDFIVYEGSGSEIETRESALRRDDLTPTTRFLLEQDY